MILHNAGHFIQEIARMTTLAQLRHRYHPVLAAMLLPSLLLIGLFMLQRHGTAQYRDKLYMGNIHGNAINVDNLERNRSTYFRRHMAAMSIP